MDPQTRLECLRLAGGDLAKAQALYAFVIGEQSQQPALLNDPVKAFEAECAKRRVRVIAAVSAAGVAPSTYWRWRHGKQDPRRATMRRLHETLDRLSRSAA